MSGDHLETTNLQSYFQLARRRRGVIALMLLIGLAVSVTRAQGSPRYAASALILLQARGIDASGVTAGRTGRPGTGGTGYVGDLFQASVVLQSKAMRDRVERRLGYPAYVETTVINFTDLIRIKAETDDPKTSADIANAFAAEYRDFRREQNESVYEEAIASLNASIRSLRRQVAALDAEISALPADSPQRSAFVLLRATHLNTIALFESRASSLEVNATLFASTVQLVEPALVPVSSTAPTRREQLKVGVILGLVLAGLAVTIIEFFDRRVASPGALERPGQPVLATVPRVVRWRFSRRPHLAGGSRSEAVVTEAYRALRSTLAGLPLHRESDGLVVAFNGRRPGSGTTTTVLNLAHLFAASGRSTLLLDLDANQRSASKFGGRPTTDPGFAEYVDGTHLLHAASTALGTDGLVVMGAGNVGWEPAEFLAKPAIEDAIGQLRTMFDVILIDTPPLEHRTDSLSFVAIVDAVLLVAPVGRLTNEELDESIEAITRAGGVVVGTIVTAVRLSFLRRLRTLFTKRPNTRRTTVLSRRNA